MEAPLARPLYVHGASFAFFHAANPDAPPRSPVLVVPPFGWDDICSYRPRRDWAEHLAAEGHPALRIDLPGTADSPGGPRDPGRVRSWTEAVEAGARELRDLSGRDRLAAIGIGLGGLALLQAVAEGAEIEELVLWGVPARGRALVRELKAFARLETSESTVPDDEDEAAVPDDALEAAGFFMSPETVDSLTRLDVRELDLTGSALRRILILDRDGIDVDSILRQHLEELDAEVSTARGHGWSLFMEEPQLAKPPLETFAGVSEWLAQSGEFGPASGAGGSDVAGQVEFVHDDRRLRETPVTFEGPSGRLFGVLAEPLDAEPAELTALLLNPGGLRRIGAGRMWVEIARDWAARGVPTFRLDLAGLGDSDGDAERYADTAELYREDLTDQVLVALDELERRGLPNRFLSLGLCSGAFWSFHASLRDQRVVSTVLLNPRALFWDESLGDARNARKVAWAADPSRWRRLLTGKAPVRALIPILRALLRAPVVYGRRALNRRRRKGELVTAFDRLRDSGQRGLLVFGEDEPLRDELEREGYLADLDRWPNLAFEALPGNSHTFKPIRAQRRARAVVDERLESELQRWVTGDAPAGIGAASS